MGAAPNSGIGGRGVYIAELAVFNSVLSATDRANVEAGFALKYGLTITGGGTPVDPTTISGLMGWWKADSLVSKNATLIRKPFKALAATLSPVAALNRRLSRSLTAALSFVGATTRKIPKTFSATLFGGISGTCAGVISYWKMDEAAAGARADSTGTNNLTDLNGNVSSATGKINAGALFGGNGSLYIASNSSVQVTGDFTFSAWVRVDAQPANLSGIIAKYGGGAGLQDYLLGYQSAAGGGAGFLFGLPDGGTSFALVGATVPNGQWHHLVGWFDSSDGKARLRVDDATTYVSSASGVTTQSGSSLTIGSTDAGAYPLTGIVDEVGFWKRKLTSAEITALYNGGSGLPLSSFGLNDGDSVSSWLDSSGNGHEATQTGTARPIFKKNILNGNPVVRFTSAGLSKLNLAIPISGADPWTVLVVMKAVNTSSELVSLAADSSSQYPTGPIEHINGVTYLFSRSFYWADSGGLAGAFHVITGRVVNSTTGDILADGTSVGIAQGGVSSTANFANIGYRANDNLYSDGDIAEIVFCNVALSATDRQNAEKTLSVKYGTPAPPAGNVIDLATLPGLQGWWKADSLLSATIFGSLTRKPFKALPATLSFSGSLSRRIGKALSAGLSFVGNLATNLIHGGGTLFTQSFTATLSFSGALTRTVGHFFTQAFTATLSFSGALSRKTGKALTATLSFVGGLTKRSTRTLAATLSTSGLISRSIGKNFSAILSSTASLTKRIARAFAATLTSVGALVKLLRDAGFTATLSFAGNVATTTAHFFSRSFTATLSFSGNLARSVRFARAFTATLSFSGTIWRKTTKIFSATLTFVGAIRKTIRKSLTATLSFIGFLFRGGLTFFKAGQVAGSTVDIAVAGSSAAIGKAGSELEIVKSLDSGARISVTGSQLRIERTK
jgi:hypothetical protein